MKYFATLASINFTAYWKYRQRQISAISEVNFSKSSLSLGSGIVNTMVKQSYYNLPGL